MIFFNHIRRHIGRLPFFGSMTPAALLSALQEMAISHSDSLGFSVQYNLTHHCFWSVVNWHLKLYRMPKYNETITLQTWSDKFARFQANRSLLSAAVPFFCNFHRAMQIL